MSHDSPELAPCACDPRESGVFLARRALLGSTASVVLALRADWAIAAITAPDTPVNLAVIAAAAAGYVSGDTALTALNNGASPANSADDSHGRFGTWPHTDPQWIEYRWEEPVTTDAVDIYWWVDGAGIAVPQRATLSYWDGASYRPVANAKGNGVAADRFNRTTFDPVRTTRLRLEAVGDGVKSIGMLQWKVYSSGPVPSFAPIVAAGIDRSLIVGGQTYLAGKAEWLQRAPGDALRWEKVSGPGTITFHDPRSAITRAQASAPGDYVLRLTATAGEKAAQSTLQLKVQSPPPAKRLDVVYTRRYAIDGPLWKARFKALIVNWIPHCVAYCERTDLRAGQGGIDNFIEAGKALRGEPHSPQRGYVFANAWVHQTVESICLALMVDPQDDAEITAAQAHLRDKLETWIPIILAAQEPDGYLQTAYTLANRADWPERWSPTHRWAHEGYLAGYFIESAISHYELTQGQDRRLYDAAKKLADCWVAHIGPGRKAWFDGHQELEQALVRFGRFINDKEGGGHGDAYIRLARFLLESRKGGSEYDQSHLPLQQQYEAVGHAVRAVYFYSAMADIAAETGDRDYQSAVISLWDNMVNRKYYVTGGVGSGDTAEGFGKDYALGNHAYCESCSSCGLIFFQYKLNLAYHDAKYADLYEETLYNALLGSLDLEGKTFCYTNPLIDTQRAQWHDCPCCVGNIPRTLLMMPTWAYTRSDDGIHVNLFVGSRIDVGEVAGTRVEMVQQTDYPWKGGVAITVNPERPARFAVRVRVPNHTTSALYQATPAVRGLERLTVNGKAVAAPVERGYAVITREWRPGDRIAFDVPMAVQKITADERIAATRGQTAFRYGPLVYNVETADQPRIDLPLGKAPVRAEWRDDLLGGVVALRGRWADGSEMVAIPNFARMNRTGEPIKQFPGDVASVNYAPGAPGGNQATTATDAPAAPPHSGPRSRVWIDDIA